MIRKINIIKCLRRSANKNNVRNIYETLIYKKYIKKSKNLFLINIFILVLVVFCKKKKMSKCASGTKTFNTR